MEQHVLARLETLEATAAELRAENDRLRGVLRMVGALTSAGLADGGEERTSQPFRNASGL